MPLYHGKQAIETTEETKPCPCGCSEIVVKEIPGKLVAVCSECGKRAPGISVEQLESVVEMKIKEAWQLRDDLINRDWNDSI